MEKRIKDRYNDTILQEAMRRYGVAKGRIRLLDGFESFMYEFEREQKAYILRIGHSLRRSIRMILGEVDWINYLSSGGTSVARVILSETDNMVELIDDGQGGEFMATAFVKAPGGSPEKTAWKPKLFETYGQLIGRMHRLTQEYKPAALTWRPHWNDAEMLEVERFLPTSEAKALIKFRALTEHLNALPGDKESYGLVHQDAHAGNFFVDETGHITLFDFDDCAYNWFINDIAIVLFYAVMWVNKDIPGFTREFMAHFLWGYRRENEIDARWLKEIPYFLKLREIDLYAVIHRSFDVNNLDDPWVENYMRNRKERIENDIPYIDFDFESLSQYL